MTTYSKTPNDWKTSVIKHIVMWKLKDFAENASKRENLVTVKGLLDACSQIVTGILKYETAIAQPNFDATYDIVLYAEFASIAALDAYNRHPQHQALKPFVAAVREARQCIDYEI